MTCEIKARSELELPVAHEAPAMARAFLRSSGCARHHGTVLDDAVLLVSELVTNSVVHGGPPLVVAVDCDGETLQVRVRDGSSVPPEPREADQSAEGGRGLALVAGLSSDWGVDPAPDGKHVWFVMREPTAR